MSFPGDLPADGSGLDYSDIGANQRSGAAQLPFMESLSDTASTAFMSGVRGIADYVDLSQEHYRAQLDQQFNVDPTADPGGALIDPKEWQQKYPDLGLTFTPDMGQAEAQLLVNHKQDELRRQYVLDHSPDSFMAKTARGLTDLAVSAIDPVNIAAAFVPGVGEARAALWASKLGTFGGRLAEGAAAGAIGTAALQPLQAEEASAWQDHYGPMDAFLNVAFGAALGGGLHAGVGLLSDIMGRASSETRVAALRGAVAQAMEGRPVDIGPVIQADPAFWTQKAEFDPQFKNWFSGSKAVDEDGTPLTLYHGTTGAFDAFSPDRLGQFTNAPSAKEGFFFTDRPKTADFYAGGEFGLKDTTDLYGKQIAFNEKMARMFRSVGNDAAADEVLARNAGRGGPNIFPAHLQLKNPLIHDFEGKVYRDETYKNLIAQAKREGRDGVILKNTFDAGEHNRLDALMKGRLSPENIYVAFDPDQIRSTFQASDADPMGGIAQAKQDSLDFAHGQEPSPITGSPEESAQAAKAPLTRDDLEGELAEAQERLKGMREQGLISDEEHIAFNDANKADEDAAKTRTLAAVRAAACLAQ